MALIALKNDIGKLLRTKFRAHLFILVAIFLYFIGYSGLEAQFSVYATEHLGATGGEAGLTLGFFSLSFVVFAIPEGLVGYKLGKWRTMLFGLVFLTFIFIIMTFFYSLNLLYYSMFISCILIS